jgi:hypothetical protein
MKKLIVIILSVSLAGCWLFEEPDCSDEIADLESQYGVAEEVDRYDSSDYHSHTYWYWSRGYSKTFTWGSIVGACEISTYTFAPIY